MFMLAGMTGGGTALAVAAGIVTVSVWGASGVQAAPDHLPGMEPMIVTIEPADDDPANCHSGGTVELRDGWDREYTGTVQIDVSGRSIWILNRCPQDYEITGPGLEGGRVFVPGLSRANPRLQDSQGPGTLRARGAAGEPSQWPLNFIRLGRT